jgi:predicted HicB family RNase H-like nuclease
MSMSMGRLHVVIPDTLHKRAKAAAAMSGETLKDYVIEAIEAAVQRDEAERQDHPED